MLHLQEHKKIVMKAMDAKRDKDPSNLPMHNSKRPCPEDFQDVLGIDPLFADRLETALRVRQSRVLGETWQFTMPASPATS